jgi:hypothetical protein
LRCAPPLRSAPRTASGGWQNFCNEVRVVPPLQGRRRSSAVEPHRERMEVRMKSILDPTFRYTSSANTDLRKTFARIRRESRRQSQSSVRDEADAKKVTPIFRGQRPAA